VIRLSATAAGAVDLTMHHITHSKTATLNPAAMDKHPAVADDAINDDDQTVAISAITDQKTAITHLTAAFAIERSAVQHHLDHIAIRG
jgi:hypothetical protein